MARAKWNPATGRFESQAGSDTPPYYVTEGQQYRDAITGETKIKNGAGRADTVVSNASPTTQPKAPKSTTSTTSAPKSPLEEMQNNAAQYANKPTIPTSTTPTTMAPKASPTTTAPRKPSPTTTVAPKTGPTTTTVPKATTTTTVPVSPTTTLPPVDINAAVAEAYKNGDWTQVQSAITALQNINASGGGGSGTKTDTPAELAAKYRANVEAANIQARAGATAQTEYNQIGQTAYDNAMNTANPMFAGQTADTNTFYDNQLAAIKKYYDEQNTTASKTISDAGAAFLAGLPDATAFANAQVANLPQAQQGLGDALAAYGATGAKAQEVSTQDAAYLDAIAKMQTSANAQLSAADKAYMTALRTAGQGANTAAQQALAGNLAGLRAQDTSGANTARRGELATIAQNKNATTSDAEALRQQYISKGIEALMSGKQTAAATKAQAASDYGVPKKAKSKKTTKN